jgi:Uma2 family endonuclease
MVMPAVERRWTAREVRQLIAESPLATPRYELVDGELLVTPSPNWVHQTAVSLILIALQEYLKTQPIGRAATSPFDVELEPESLVQPDVFVVPLHEARRLLTEMPARELVLAVEVLSPSSGRHDRVKKRPHYQRHVPEYWIIDLDARLVERWRPGDDRPEIVAEALEWSPAGSAEPLRIDLARYFAAVFDEL